MCTIIMTKILSNILSVQVDILKRQYAKYFLFVVLSWEYFSLCNQYNLSALTLRVMKSRNCTPPKCYPAANFHSVGTTLRENEFLIARWAEK